MTVSYTFEVADSKGIGSFLKLLARWKGSIYKLVWRDMLIYTVLYYSLAAVYRFALSEESKRVFEKVCLHTSHFTELIPLSFVLGFYVSIVFNRWWTQYITIPWPDSLAVYCSTFIVGHDDKGRMMRRTILRYANLAFTMTFTLISPKAKKRFPSWDHLIEAGLLTASEKKIFEYTTANSSYSIYWMPLVWAGTIVARARKEGRIRDDIAVKTIVDEINRVRGQCGSLLSYDWISIPLVYTQVVTLAVYTFFLSTLLGRQFLDPTQKYEKNDIDLYFPIFTYLQFFFYMGWLKVAETLVNPFGEDDDDFEVNYLIDRNVKVSYLIVDEMHNEHPELVQDIYWDQIFPEELPYTVASEEFRTEAPQGSTANLEVPLEKQEILPPLSEESGTDDDSMLDDVVEKGHGTHRSPNFSARSGSIRNIASNLSGILMNIGKKNSSSSMNRRKSSSRPRSRASSRARSSKGVFSMASLNKANSNQILPELGGRRVSVGLTMHSKAPTDVYAVSSQESLFDETEENDAKAAEEKKE